MLPFILQYSLSSEDLYPGLSVLEVTIAMTGRTDATCLHGSAEKMIDSTQRSRNLSTEYRIERYGDY